MNLNNIEIDVENLENILNFDINILKNDITKMFQFLLTSQDIFKKTCLDNKNFKYLQFDLTFCDDQTICSINHKYRNKNKPTDVLTFAIFADSDTNEQIIIDETINLGQVLISVETLTRQAKENSVCEKFELYFLVVHAILHLLGFDHKTQQEYDFMIDLQKSVLNIFEF